MIQTTKISPCSSARNSSRGVTGSVALLGALWASLFAGSPLSVLEAAPLTLPPSQTVSSNTTYEGGTWSSGNLTINSGITATLDNGNTLVYTAPSNSQLIGGGTLSNEGDFDYNASAYMNINNFTKFDNAATGVLNLNGTNSRFYLQTNGIFRNLGGVINANGTGGLIDANGLFTTFDGSTLHSLNLNVTAGNNFSVTANQSGGQVQLGTVTIGAGGYAYFSTPAVYTDASSGGTGDINFNQTGQVRLGSFGMGTNVIFNNVEGSVLQGGTIDANGNTMTVNSGRTVTMNGSNVLFIDNGTFINDGTVNMNLTTNSYWGVNSGSTFENNGILNMNGPGARIYTLGGTINNYGGTINVNTSGAHMDSSGVFNTWDGSTLHNLNLNINSGDFRLLTSGTGGRIGLNLPSVPSGSFVTFSTPSVFENAGGGDLDFSYDGAVHLGSFGMGTNVILNAAENHQLQGGTIDANGNTMTLMTGRTVTMNGSNVLFVDNGTFINDGTIDMNLTTNSYWGVNAGSTLENNSVINMNGPGARIYLAGGTINNYGGTFNVNTSGAYIDSSGVFNTWDGSTLHDFNLNINSGDFRLITTGTGGQISLNMSNIPSGSYVTFSTPSLFTQSGGGDLNFAVDGALNLGTFNMGTNVILDAAEGHEFQGGTISNNGFDMTLETGRSLQAKFSNSILTGSGKFYNKGDIGVDLNVSQYLGVTNGVEFVNEGSLSLDYENARIYRGGNGTFNNQGGTFTKEASTAYAFLDGGGFFKNTGTVFVPGGELELRDGTLLSYSAGTLNEGTWIMDSTATGTAVLDLIPAAAGINIIGAGADVQLIGTGANLLQLTSTFAGLDGKLKLSEGKQLNVNLFGMGSNAELTLGLGSLAATNSVLEVNGDLTANGLINIENLGGMEVGVYDLILFDGELTDLGIALGSLPSLFDDGTYTARLIVPASGTIGGSIQLSIGYVPEPGTSSLLGLGLLGLMGLRRRKRQNAKA